MNKRTIIASLNEIANELDTTGLYKEANSLTYVMKKIAQELDYDNDMDPPRRGDGKSIPPYNWEQRITPTQRITDPEDESLVNKSYELLDKALKIFKPQYSHSIPYVKLQYLRRETIGQNDNTPEHLKLPESRITDFNDNVNSKYKYDVLLNYLNEFYKLCEGNVLVKTREMQYESEVFKYPQSDVENYERNLQSFLEEIQNFINEVEMIASDYQETRI